MSCELHAKAGRFLVIGSGHIDNGGSEVGRSPRFVTMGNRTGQQIGVLPNVIFFRIILKGTGLTCKN